MKRAYLEEDLGLICKYFPGAKVVAFHTPFEISPKPSQGAPDMPQSTYRYRADEHGRWLGGIAWMS